MLQWKYKACRRISSLVQTLLFTIINQHSIMSLFDKPKPTPTPDPEPQKVIPIQDLTSLIDGLVDSLFDNPNFLERLRDEITETADNDGNFEDKLLDNRDCITDIVKEDVVVTVDSVYLSS